MHSILLGLLCLWQCLKHFPLFFKVGQDNCDLTLFFFRQKFYYHRWITKGGWPGFGTALGGMDPTGFDVNWTHPTKIPTLTIYGAKVQKCPWVILGCNCCSSQPFMVHCIGWVALSFLVGNNFVSDGHVCNTLCPVLLKLVNVRLKKL